MSLLGGIADIDVEDDSQEALAISAKGALAGLGVGALPEDGEESQEWYTAELERFQSLVVTCKCCGKLSTDEVPMNVHVSLRIIE